MLKQKGIETISQQQWRTREVLGRGSTKIVVIISRRKNYVVVPTEGVGSE